MCAGTESALRTGAVRRARQRGESLPAHRAGERGTDIHTYVHQLALGEEVDPPDGFRDHVDAYLKFAEDWQPKELVAEAAVINRTHRYMGTLDTIADLVDADSSLEHLFRSVTHTVRSPS